MEPTDLWRLVREGGATAVLLLILIGVFIRKWIVPGWLYSDAVKEKDEWKTIALEGIGATKQSADTTQTSLGALQQAIEVVERIREADREEKR